MLNYDEKCDEYENKYREIKRQLREKLDKEVMNKIQGILTDCEKLIEQELELETRLNDKSLRIKEHKQNLILQTIDNKKEKELLEKEQIIEKEEATNQKQIEELKRFKQQNLSLQLELAKAQGKLEAKEEDFNKAISIRVSNVSVQQGNAIIGNQSRDNANLSHTVQTNQEQQAQILQPPYGTPGSSKN